MCPTCEKSGNGGWSGLNDLGVGAPSYSDSYLMECPMCGALWMGHGHTSHYMMELTQAEASDIFPDWRNHVRPQSSPPQ
jgi:hypothetical protein